MKQYPERHFFLDHLDQRLEAKERVLGVQIDSGVKAYRFTSFPGSSYSIVSDQLNGNPIIVVGSKDKNIMFAVIPVSNDGTDLDLEILPAAEDAGILVDQEGNVWDVFGHAISGPRKGEKLNRPNQYIGYWFAWSAFYPEIEIFK